METEQSVCDPICDFCVFYDFNADEDGAYTGDGQCEHLAHPGPADPMDWCADFKCRFCETDHDGGSKMSGPGGRINA